MSLHQRRDGIGQHATPGGVYSHELYFNKTLYKNVRVQGVDPLQWLVPKQKQYRTCTRTFYAPCLQSLELEGISLGEGGETSGAGVRASYGKISPHPSN